MAFKMNGWSAGDNTGSSFKKKFGPVKGRIGSEYRKKEYDARGWKYDDTIAGYNKDGSKKNTTNKNTKDSTKSKTTKAVDSNNEANYKKEKAELIKKRRKIALSRPVELGKKSLKSASNIFLGTNFKGGIMDKDGIKGFSPVYQMFKTVKQGIGDLRDTTKEMKELKKKYNK